MRHQISIVALMLTLSHAPARASMAAASSAKGVSAGASSPASFSIQPAGARLSEPGYATGVSQMRLGATLEGLDDAVRFTPSANPSAQAADVPLRISVAPVPAATPAPFARETRLQQAPDASVSPMRETAALREVRSNARGLALRKAAADAAPWLNEVRAAKNLTPAVGAIASVRPAREALARRAVETPVEASTTDAPPAPAAPKAASRTEDLLRILGADPWKTAAILTAASGSIGVFLGGAGIAWYAVLLAAPLLLLLLMMTANRKTSTPRELTLRAATSALALAYIAAFTTAAWSVLGVRLGEWTFLTTALALFSGTTLSVGLANLTYGMLGLLIPARFFKKDPPGQTLMEFAARHAFALAAAVAGLAAANGALIGGLPFAVDGWMSLGWSLMLLGSVFSWPRHILRMKPRAAAIANSLTTFLGGAVVVAGMAQVAMSLFLEGLAGLGLASALISAGLSVLVVLFSGKLVQNHLSAGLAGKHSKSVLAE